VQPRFIGFHLDRPEPHGRIFLHFLHKNNGGVKLVSIVRSKLVCWLFLGNMYCNDGLLYKLSFDGMFCVILVEFGNLNFMVVFEGLHVDSWRLKVFTSLDGVSLASYFVWFSDSNRLLFIVDFLALMV